MKMCRLGFLIVGALLVMTFPSPAIVFFSDNFSNGSTLNGASAPGGTPNASYTSYDLASSKNTTYSTIAPNELHILLSTNTTSGYWEAQALFTTNPIALVSDGDYIDLDIVFTNSTLSLLTNSSKSALWIGLYNSGAAGSSNNPPVAGALANTGLTYNQGSDYATGNCQLWAGYVGQIKNGTYNVSDGLCRIVARPVQNGADTSSANQELLGNGVSSGTYNNPGGDSYILATSAPQTNNLASNGVYTLELGIRLDLSGSGGLMITNVLYQGIGEGGPALYTNSTTVALNSAIPLAFGGPNFDGLAFGAFNSGNPGGNPQMDISSITVSGYTNSPNPVIPVWPSPVIVATNGSCAMWINPPGGLNMTYQWHRNGTNLTDGGNISGATTPMLIISPAGPDDAASTANGYYVTVTGPGGYTVNSTTNSLVLDAAADLVWSGTGTDWNVVTSADWLNGAVGAVFNFGDNVTFNDVAASGSTEVNLANNYLAAGSVTVSNSVDYTFVGSGSIAGPCSLLYEGSGRLILDCANSYTGGTIISNASAYLILSNYAGLGSGPVTLAKAGGMMEVQATGSAVAGMAGDIVVADDFTIQFDGSGSYAGVMFGSLSGTSGKTLTLEPANSSSTNRYRVYGNNTVYNGNLVLNGPSVDNANYEGTALAPYNGSGTQTYNGVISGNGGLVQRGSGTTILNGQNTYAGGTTPTIGAIGIGVDSTGNPVTTGPIGTGPLYLAPEVFHTSGAATILSYGGPRIVANPIEYPSATNNLTLIIGGTNALTLSGPIFLNGLDGIGTNTIRTFKVANTANTVFSGVVSDAGAGFGLTKTGNGTLALNSPETYTGPTTVSAGTLEINGSLEAASTITVNSNAVLSGNGVVAGAVTINPGGTLAPGTASTIGTLNIQALTNNGGLLFKVDTALSPPQSNDTVSVSGALISSGTGMVTVSNIGPALAVGDRFSLFDRAVPGGETLAVIGSGAVWNNNLAVDGSVSVASTTLPRPVITNVIVVQGTNLVFSGLHDAQGYSYCVMTSTNLATPLSNWESTVTSRFVTGGTFSITNTVSPAEPERFYLLKLID